MIRLLLILLVVVFPIYSNADATPKFYNRIVFEFVTEENTPVDVFDSVVVFTNPYEDSSFVDTIHINREPRAYSDFYLNYYNGEWIFLEKRKLDFFKLSLWSNGKKYDSPWIIHSGQRSVYRFIAREDGKLYDDSPPFYAAVSDYCMAFFMTILLEMLYFVWLNRKLKFSLKKILWVVLIVNIISHPLLWWMHSHTNINVLFLEVSVVLIESVVLYMMFSGTSPYTKFLKWSLFSNLISWILGGVLMFILTTNF